MSEIEIGRCPWCGKQAELRLLFGSSYVECPTCFAHGPTFNGHGAEKAIQAWNSLVDMIGAKTEQVDNLKKRLRDVVNGDLIIVTHEWACPTCGFSVDVIPTGGESGATSGTPIMCPECFPDEVWMERGLK